MKLERVVSGGQTGVDQAALRAAKQVGIPTGGWAPYRWMTLDGPAPWLSSYGLTTHGGGYAMRTETNVRESHGTLRIASDFSSPGEICTKRAIRAYRRPELSLPLSRLNSYGIDRFISWINAHDIRILNVAGNSERTSPGIGALAERFLIDAFSALIER